MKIMFCNITYMNRYTGNIEEDIPRGGGAWVEKHKDAHEKWNFLNVDGYCFGFVMNQSDQFHIERLEGTSRQDAAAEDVTVVWCAHKPSGETVIVGWYEHATVYRYYLHSMATPIGLDRDYFVKAKAEDCYLLPEEAREYTIGRAAVLGKGMGFGQSNFWYADSAYARENIVPDVAAYLETMKNLRVNDGPEAFREPANVDTPLSSGEQELADQYLDDGEDLRFLPLGFRRYRQEPNGDNAFAIAGALRDLYQFSSAIEWFRKVIEIEGSSWEADSNLLYLLMECERYEEAISAATDLLAFREAKDPEVKREIYGAIADSNYYLGRIEDAVSWLDKVIEESKDPELVQYIIETKEIWLSQR